MTWEEVVARLAGLGTAHLATADATGRPHVAVVMPGVDGEVLWFATWTDAGKAHNLRANPRASLVWEGNGAETYLWADAAVVADRAEVRRVWEAGVLPYDPAGFFGSPDNPRLVLVRLVPTRAVVMAQGAEGIERQVWRPGPPAG